MYGAEFNQLITPDGVVYSLDGIVDRALMTTFDGEGMPPVEYPVQQGPQQHGQTVLSYRLQPRIMQVLFRRNARDRQGYWDIRKELIDMVRPNRKPVGSRPTPFVLRKIFPDYTIRDIDVLIAQGPNFESSKNDWDEFSFEEALRFIAHDPTFYDPNVVNIATVTNVITNLVVPTSVPLIFGSASTLTTVNHVYTGTWLSYPIITMTGPLNSVVITNVTTGEEIQFTHPLISGQQAVIDTRFGYKIAYDPSLPLTDPASNLIGSVRGDLGTFHLDADPQAAGGVNQLQIRMWVVRGQGSVQIQYYTRYLGI